jgi:hypothetical protein
MEFWGMKSRRLRRLDAINLVANLYEIPYSFNLDKFNNVIEALDPI